MRKALENRSSPVPVLAMVLLAALAGCTTKGTSTPTTPDVAQPRVKASELRAYCPTVTLRDGTAYFSTYSGDRTPDNVVYQAALTDTTRSCQYGDGTIIIDAAVAGKVVPGPKYHDGTITMPIRLAVLQGGKVVYSKLQRQTATITNGDTATQFMFNDKGITVPRSGQNDLQVFVGFDEGPATADHKTAHMGRKRK